MFRVIEARRLALQGALAALALAVLVFSSVRASPAVPHHDIRLAMDASTGELRIRDRVLVSGQTEYRFRLASWLRIEQLRINQSPVEVQAQNDGYRVVLSGGGQHRLEFELNGRLPPRADAGAAASSHAADGSFLPAWDAWIPHHPTQALAFRLALEVSAGQRAVASGRLVTESSAGSTYSAVFEQARPGKAPSLFVGPYQVRETVRDEVRLRTYFHPGLDDFAQTYLDSAANYIDRYRRDIGDYPYADFHVVSAPLPVGLGFAGLAYVDRRIVPLPFMQTRSLAHEVLHNWWGNAVAVDYATGNWAEGLTTYLADYALERDKGAGAARAMRVRWLRDYAALPVSRDQAIRDFRTKEHQAGQVIGYNKVAFVFHMLERQIGQLAFDDGIRRFWRDNRFRTAAWGDLQRAFEHTAKRDLGAFFRQWIDQRGAPRLSLGAHSVTAVDGGYRTRVELVQPVAGYRFELPVRLDTETGSVNEDIEIDSTRTLLEWVTPAKPVFIHFDANRDLFRRLDAAETPPILRDVTLNPKTQTRIIGDADFTETARRLAARLLDTAPDFVAPNQAREAQRPLLLITPAERLDARLAKLGIELPAALPRSNHSAAAWTARFQNGTPLLVVTADSSAALEALLRPLPHYGGQSYVLFASGRALERGTWKIKRGPLYRDLRGG